MKIDALFDFAQVFDIQNRIDVLQGQSFTLIMDTFEGVEFFANNDPVLNHQHSGSDVTITASEVGESTARFMVGDDTVRKILIRVVSEFVRPATDLGVTIGEPEVK